MSFSFLFHDDSSRGLLEAYQTPLSCFVSFKWLHVSWLDFHNLCPSVGVTVTESPLFLMKLHHTLETWKRHVMVENLQSWDICSVKISKLHWLVDEQYWQKEQKQRRELKRVRLVYSALTLHPGQCWTLGIGRRLVTQPCSLSASNQTDRLKTSAEIGACQEP